MIERLKQLEKLVENSVAEGKTLHILNNLRVEFLGKSGKLTALLKEIGQLPPEERPKFGELVNKAKSKISKQIEDRYTLLETKEQEIQLESELLDVSLPGVGDKLGSEHPLIKTLNDIQTIFYRLGYVIADGPEIETDHYNFEALNFPADHPARDLHDTFFVQGGGLLRTHTSPVQIRVMENSKPQSGFI